MFNALEPWHLIIIVGVLVVLFGAKRLPGSARSLGQSMRIFRSEVAQAREDADPKPESAPTTAIGRPTPAADPAPDHPADQPRAASSAGGGRP